MATDCSILSWNILWTEEPGGLHAMGLQKSWAPLSNWAHNVYRGHSTTARGSYIHSLKIFIYLFGCLSLLWHAGSFCGVWTLNCSVWNLVPWPGLNSCLILATWPQGKPLYVGNHKYHLGPCCSDSDSLGLGWDWESWFLGRLIRSLGVPKERGVWNSQGGGKDKHYIFLYVP